MSLSASKPCFKACFTIVLVGEQHTSQTLPLGVVSSPLLVVSSPLLPTSSMLLGASLLPPASSLLLAHSLLLLSSILMLLGALLRSSSLPEDEPSSQVQDESLRTGMANKLSKPSLSPNKTCRPKAGWKLYFQRRRRNFTSKGITSEDGVKLDFQRRRRNFTSKGITSEDGVKLDFQRRRRNFTKLRMVNVWRSTLAVVA